MPFSSQVFVLVFLPACLAAWWVFHSLRRGSYMALPFLIGASLLFYAWWRTELVLLLVASVGANYAIGQRIRRLARDRWEAAAKRALAVGIAANLVLLGWFKYADFAARTVGLTPPGIALPLAISFFTFQQIMFLAESRRDARGNFSFVSYAAFVTFFPHLIAGPIVRPSEIIPQFACAPSRRIDPDALPSGLTLFLIGLAKKLVLADTFAPLANAGFDAAARGTTLTLVEAWVAVLAFALQIYFDFSGYSDMAIGLARMFGIHFPVNFNAPYQAASIAEFWRRWHITLSAFLRDYVYIPLGGNRRGPARQHVNLMATMLLGGLWHGAAWNFVAWGGLHGAYLIAHRLWSRRAPFALPRPAGQTLTLLAVLVAWVPFRAATADAAWRMLRGMAGIDGVAVPQLFVDAFPVLGHIATPVPVLLHLGDARTLALPEAAACLLLGWVIVLLLSPVQDWSERVRAWSLVGSFAFSAQALFFAPNMTPFLYFRF
jgi:alginate O-acetyltransferase complex protein AlgI